MIASPAFGVVRVRAPAKLNLFFEVLSKRSDGFHEIETLMTPIDLFDDLSFSANDSGCVSLDCTWAGPNTKDGDSTLGTLPAAEDNLAWRAVRLLQEQVNVALGGHLELVKRIPSAAGLGGGSSDAAAALVAANAAWKLGLSRETLSHLGAELGSDVPFFLYDGAAVCRGRGELIEPVAGIGTLHAVVIRPPEGLSTAAVYGRCRAAALPVAVGSLIEQLRSGAWQSGMKLVNRLQVAAEEISDWIVRLRKEFTRLGCVAAQMSGSGSSYFGIFASARAARRAGALLRSRQWGRVFVVQTGLRGASFYQSGLVGH